MLFPEASSRAKRACTRGRSICFGSVAVFPAETFPSAPTLCVCLDCAPSGDDACSADGSTPPDPEFGPADLAVIKAISVMAPPRDRGSAPGSASPVRVRDSHSRKRSYAGTTGVATGRSGWWRWPAPWTPDPPGTESGTWSCWRSLPPCRRRGSGTRPRSGSGSETA